MVCTDNSNRSRFCECSSNAFSGVTRLKTLNTCCPSSAFQQQHKIPQFFLPFLLCRRCPCSRRVFRFIDFASIESWSPESSGHFSGLRTLSRKNACVLTAGVDRTWNLSDLYTYTSKCMSLGCKVLEPSSWYPYVDRKGGLSVIQSNLGYNTACL